MQLTWSRDVKIPQQTHPVLAHNVKTVPLYFEMWWTGTYIYTYTYIHTHTYIHTYIYTIHHLEWLTNSPSPEPNGPTQQTNWSTDTRCASNWTAPHTPAPTLAHAPPPRPMSSPPVTAASIWSTSHCHCSSPAHLSSLPLWFGLPLVAAALIQPTSCRRRSDPLMLAPIIVCPIRCASHCRHCITSFTPLPRSHCRRSITFFTPQRWATKDSTRV
jgi:hypothetical protein